MGPRTEVMPWQVGWIDLPGGAFVGRAVWEGDGNLVLASGHLGWCRAGNAMVRADHDTGANFVHAVGPSAGSGFVYCHVAGASEKCGVMVRFAFGKDQPTLTGTNVMVSLPKISIILISATS